MHNLSSRLAIKGHGDRSRYALLKRYGVKTKFISASDPTLGGEVPSGRSRRQNPYVEEETSMGDVQTQVRPAPLKALPCPVLLDEFKTTQ